MEMQRGQRVKLQDAQVVARLEARCEIGGIPASDLRVLLLALDDKEQLVDGTIIDASGGRRTCEGVTAGGTQGFDLDLARLPGRVARLAIVVGVTESARAKGVYAHAIQAGAVTVKAGSSTVGVYRFRGADFGKETALCLVEIYRKDGWRMMASGVGFLGGLPSLVSRYGGRLEDLEGSSLPRIVGGGGGAPAGGGSGGGGGGLPPISELGGPVRLPAHYAGRRDPAVPAGLTPAVGLVLVERSEGAATGTGFMIGPGGFFVTCAHVIRDAKSVAIGLEGTHEMRPAVIVKVDPDGDLALLHTVDRLGSTDWLMLARADAAPTLGDNLGLLGYPLGGDLGINLTYSQGVVNSLRKAENIPILQVDTGAAPGSSGGPVFRRSDGHVVGVLTSGLSQQRAGMLVNFAVDIRRLYHLGWVS